MDPRRPNPNARVRFALGALASAAGLWACGTQVEAPQPVPLPAAAGSQASPPPGSGLPQAGTGAGTAAGAASTAGVAPAAGGGAAVASPPPKPTGPAAGTGSGTPETKRPEGTPDPASMQEPSPEATPPARLAESYYGTVWSPARIPKECQGFELEGLRYSPGGSVLPNRCEPFHQTNNNPYAVRCIDTWMNYKTEFPGDSSCILPPPPELGTQIGAHPQATNWYAQVAAGDLSGYANPSDDWVMQPSEEETLSFRTSSSNVEPHKYYRVYYRMRPGSHHMGVSAHDDSDSEREIWLPGNTLPSQFDPLLGPLVASIGAIQRPDDNNPVSLEVPEEDAGFYYEFPSGAAIVMNMHHFNYQDTRLLKEVWINVFWESDARIPIRTMASIPVDQAFGLAVPPGDTIDLHYAWKITEPLRILRLYAHRHAWTPNFSAWIERAAGGDPEIVYQSYDWFDVPTYRYDSLTKNAAPNPAARTDGATSGVLELKAGDALHFNCHITFTDQRAAEVGVPQTPMEIGTLRFANEVYTAEMCSLLGHTVNAQLPTSPDWVTTRLPSFASP